MQSERNREVLLIEEMDNYDIVEYKVARVDKGQKRYYVRCDICVDEDKVKENSCSCLKLQSLRAPYSHIFFVLGLRKKVSFHTVVFWKGGR
jgi:zinc finger SWIM domain-containing protein 3